MTNKEFLGLCRQKNDKGFNKIKEYIDNKGKFKTIRGPFGASPLHLAVRSNSIKLVQLFIDNGINPMIRDKTKLAKTPIVDAIDKGFVKIAMILLKSPKLKPLKIKKRYNETSALGSNENISLSDYTMLLKEIIKVGFDTELLDNQGHTALTRAVQNKQIDRIKVCLDLGLNPNGDRNALGLALHNDGDDTKTIRLLIDNGADIVIKSDDDWGGFNALHAAHYYNDIKAFELLIKEYNALETLDDETLDEIITHKEIKYLTFLWEIPKVHDFIIKNNLEEAFPKEVQDIFIF